MVKNATLNLRVDASVKEKAESVLSKLGVPMSTAIDMYLNQTTTYHQHSYMYRHYNKYLLVQILILDHH